jgi:NTE family protein
MAKLPYNIALVLGGGNALGSYQAGVYQALHEHDHEPDWIVGASAGAINGALIAGSAPGDRLARLQDFWQPATSGATITPWWLQPSETLRRSTASMLTMSFGRPGVFGPVGPLGSWWNPDPRAAAPSLFDSKPLAATLSRLIDFPRLNSGAPRYTASAVDLVSGQDVLFDTGAMAITADHVRASAALLPVFPPVEIDGRSYVDGGFSANLPLDPVLGAPATGPTLCIAADLLPLAERHPRTLTEAANRAQDLVFAAQSRRTIERWRSLYAADPQLAHASVTLALLSYSDQDPEVAGKGMDFSPESVRYRWNAGYRDALAMLDGVARGEIHTGRDGLSIFGA